MGGRVLLAAWLIVLAAVAGTAAWLLTRPPPAEGPTLVLALPPMPAPDAAAAPQPAESAAPAVAAPRAGPAAAAPASAPMPRIALVVAPLGIGQAVSRAAIEQLPPAVTLAFLPYVEDAADWVRRAREAGHEALLGLPMEPVGFPKDDPGPKALLTTLDPQENLERLKWVLDRASDYVGVMSVLGSRYLASEEHMRPILAELRRRGLLFLDGGTTPRSVATVLAEEIGLPHAASDRFIDSEPTRIAIDRRLDELEQIARATGTAIAVGRPYPVTIERVAEWAATLAGRGVALVPLTAVAAAHPGAVDGG